MQPPIFFFFFFWISLPRIGVFIKMLKTVADIPALLGVNGLRVLSKSNDIIVQAVFICLAHPGAQFDA
jgi:hypothetical protein